MSKLTLIACAVTAIVVASTGSASALLIKTKPNLPTKITPAKISLPNICKNSISKTIVVNGISYTAKKCR
jgi:hypothetical protein